MNKRQKEKWRKKIGGIPNFKAGDKFSWTLIRKDSHFLKNKKHEKEWFIFTSNIPDMFMQH